MRSKSDRPETKVGNGKRQEVKGKRPQARAMGKRRKEGATKVKVKVKVKAKAKGARKDRGAQRSRGMVKATSA